MRRSGITSNCVCVVLETSMYFSGKGNDSSLGEKSLTLGSTWWRYMKFPDMHGPKIIYRFTGIQKRVVEWWKRPFWFSNKVNVTLSSNWSRPYQGGCSQVLISSRSFDLSICDWEIKFSFFLRKYHFFRIESFWVDFRCVHRFQLVKVCNQYVTLPNSHRVQSVFEEQSR